MTELLNSNKATTTSTTANSDPTTTTTTNINSNNNTSAGLFHQSKQFMNGIQALNSHNDDSRVVRLFVRVCAKAANVDAPEEEKTADVLQGGIEEAVLEEILDRVAYTPARPNQMKAELMRLGLDEGLCGELSHVWSQYARPVVTRRRRVHSNLSDVHYEILTDVATGEERLLIDFHLAPDNNSPKSSTKLSFTPEQLFLLFQQLETVQKKIDKLCA